MTPFANSIARRTVLRGAGVALALPLMESLAPRRARAAGTTVPLRFLAYFCPNGHWMSSYKVPAGALGTLSETLAPLDPVKKKLLVLQGLNRGMAAVVGAHAGGTSTFLTCAAPKATQGGDIRSGVSIDQLMAPVLGVGARFPSLQLGADGGSALGNCDTGYACAYTRNISWADPTTPMNKLTKPQAVFTYLFGDANPATSALELAARARDNKSVLDVVLEQVNGLSGRLARADQHVLDDYMTNVRQVETQLTEMSGTACVSTLPSAAAGTPPFQQQLDIFANLIMLAFQCDLTRVATFMLGNGLSLRSYAFLNGGTFTPRAHHEISHHGGQTANVELLKVIEKYEMTQVATLLQKMDAKVEANGATMLDNTVFLYGNEVADSNIHGHTDVPLFLAGGGGLVKLGRSIDYTSQPMANFYVALLNLMKIRTDGTGKPSAQGTHDITKFGVDGTAPVTQLTG